MPLGAPGYYGTDAEGKETQEYCMFCYKRGAFTQPGLTADKMIEQSVRFMTSSLGIDEAKARAMSREVIPTLRRWAEA